MSKILIALLLIFLLAVPVNAVEYTAPEAPESVEDLMPVEKESFGQGLWKVIKSGMEAVQPELVKAAGMCLGLFAVLMLIGIVQKLPGSHSGVLEFVAALAIGGILLTQTHSMIRMAADAVEELSGYGKLLIPVMTAAMSAQGWTTTAATLYAGTIAFNTFLTVLISKLLIPAVYLYLALSIASAATDEEGVKRIRDFLKWISTWALKIILYVFTGYMGITGAVSGTADAAAVKAAKLSISGMVPVVGGILSDASEAVIVGAGVVKSGIGIYGVITFCVILVTPFLTIGIQYLMLKLTGALCAGFQLKRPAELIKNFSSAMGLLLGMTGTVSVLLMISTVCFMKGVG
jgi:stage III sporulation protein AE